MVIWPEKVARGNADWDRVCSLLQVLALDPRRPLPLRSRWNASREYFTSADQFLERPMIYVDRRHVPAPHFSYAIRFNVSGSVHGSIPVDDAEQLEEFRRAINEALHGRLTQAERKRWEAAAEWRARLAANDPLAEVFASEAQEEGAKADHYYREVRAAIGGDHQAVLAGLVDVGAILRAAA